MSEEEQSAEYPPLRRAVHQASPAAARFREKAILASCCQYLVLSHHDLPHNEVAALSFGLQFHGGILTLVCVAILVT